jgi:predicted DNA binding CopG/RHH family protein
MKSKMKTDQTVRVTMKESDAYMKSKAGRDALRALATIKDEDIDTSEIPEVTDFSKWQRIMDHPEHPLFKAMTQSVTIRLAAPDVLIAKELAKAKNMPYQTLIKQLLHDALAAAVGTK